MSFFLNPHRFAGTVQEGAMVIAGAALQALSGASVAASPLFSVGDGVLTVEPDQAASGALSAAGEGVVILSGAGAASSVLFSAAAGAMTIYPDSGQLLCDAADFDSTNDYLTKLNSTMGATNSKTGILSCWFYLDALNGVFGSTLFATYYSTGVGQFSAQITTGSKLQILIQDTAGTPLLSMRTSASVSTGAWNHVLAAWDVSTATRQMYLNGTSDTGGASSSTDTNLGWSSIDDSVVGAFSFDGTAKWDGALAELYFAPSQYLDISASGNREKFISATAKPIDLGATGSTPTGTAPVIYMHLDDAETANNFAVNRGTGGNFTVNGALTTFGSSPSD